MVTVVGGAVPARQTWRESPVMLTVGVLSGCVHPLCLATVNGSGRLATLQALTTRQESDRGASRVLWRRTGVRTPRTPAQTALLSADSSLPSTAPNFCLSRSSILLLLLCRCMWGMLAYSLTHGGSLLAASLTFTQRDDDSSVNSGATRRTTRETQD